MRPTYMHVLRCSYQSRNMLKRYFYILLCVLPIWAVAHVANASDEAFNDNFLLDINQFTAAALDLKQAGVTVLPEALRKREWGAVLHAISFSNHLSVLIGFPPGNSSRALRFSGNPDFVPTSYYDYDKLAMDARGAPFIQNRVLLTSALASNEGYGYIYGSEAATYSFINLTLKTASVSFNSIDFADKAVPQHQFSVRSSLNLLHNTQWNNMIYYVDETRGANGGALYFDPNIRFDTQLEWKPVHNMECAITGRNLFNLPPAEFPASPIALVGPGFAGHLVWRF